MAGALVAMSVIGSVTAQAGTAPGDVCSADNQVNCYHCTNGSNPSKNDPSHCENNDTGWSWQHCVLWQGGRCKAQASNPVGVPNQRPIPVGAKCRFNSTTDVTREAGWQIGDINAGPLVTGESGTLYCSIHVNNNVHSGAAVVPPESAIANGGVVTMEPRTLNYPATAADTVSLCTKWVGASGTLYWVSGNPADPASQSYWTTDASESCGEALTLRPNDPECSIWLAIDQRAGTNLADIWQDCEPYSPII
jgi:hypothetical protein